jgi:hypothetical protein
LFRLLTSTTLRLLSPPLVVPVLVPVPLLVPLMLSVSCAPHHQCS